QEQIEPAPLPVGEPVASGHLPEAGESGHDTENFTGHGAVMFVQLFGGDGSRTDEGHLAAGNLPELRKFVDRVAAAERREGTGNSGIIRGLALRHGCAGKALDQQPAAARRRSPHGAELDDVDRFSTASDAWVRNEWRVTRQDGGDYGGRKQDGTRRQQQRQREAAFGPR